MATKLKSLELQGYKTFASKSLFEFPGAITAIVGPNGSGKSNIADALRWVLGEQSYSMLRGRKTEDMIFSGSEQRARGSMASVAVVFDNETGWLPVDYTEVSLARKAYRDGQNEYFLNGQRVRLRETSELLSQSGLAERTYTIIGQGLVDAALALKPEERRKFFEEAAGIGLYRSRRDDSINRLDSTKRNLERVNDILSELEPRLKSLERHAAKANEYDRVKADLEVLLKDWYGFHWSQAQIEASAAREAHKQQENNLNFLKDRLKEYEDNCALLRQQLSDTRSKLNQLHAEASEIHLSREQISRELAVVEERKRSIESQRLNSDIDLARVEEEANALASRVQSAETEHAGLLDELTDAEARLKLAEEKANSRSAERVGLERRIQELRRALLSKQTIQVQVQAHSKELRHRIEAVTANLATVQKELSSQDFVTNEKSQSLEKHTTLFAEINRKRESLAASLRSIREEIALTDLTKQSLLERWNRNNSENVRLNAQFNALQKAEEDSLGSGEGAKSLIEFVSRQHGKKAFARINQLIDVPEKLELAISAVLGSALDGLAVDTKQDLKDLVRFLADGGKGRATVLYHTPVESPKFNLPKLSGVVGRASDMVSVKQAHPVIESLLESIVIVDDLEAALDLQSKIPAECKIVTMYGEVFTGNGLVEAGKVNKNLSIVRNRELSELKRLLEQSNELLRRDQEEILKVEQKIKDQNLQLDQRSKELEQQVQIVSEHEREMRNLSFALDQAKQKSEWAKSQVNNINEQIRLGNIEIESDKQKLTSVGKEIAELEKELSSAQASLDQLPIHELQSDVIHWRTQSTVLSRGLHDAKRRLEEIQQTVQRNRINQAQYKTRLLATTGEFEDLERKLVVLKEEENSIKTRLDDMNLVTLPKEEELLKLEKQYEESTATLSSAQGQVSAGERRTAQTHFEAERLEESMVNLRKRIEEDFGLVEFSYEDDISGPKPLPFEGLVAQFTKLAELPEDLDEMIVRKRGQLKRIGPINPEAQSEFVSVKERYEFLTSQVADLMQASSDLQKVISELDDLMRQEFLKTFNAAAVEFSTLFTRVFGGGTARLILQDENNPTEAGIDIEARLPGRREQGLSLLSGGERSLTAVALIFALLKVSPTPFCVLDEVDAMLDEANVGRFGELLKELSDKTQFILITHNRNTVQLADVIYGITMGKDSTSQVVSLRLDEVSEDMVK